MRFIVPCIYKQSPYALVITAEVFSDHITFDKTPATVYEVYDRQIKTARPDQADLKSSGLGEKLPINYTLLEILGNVKDLSGIPYVVNGHLNYYLLNEGKGNYFQNGGKYKGVIPLNRMLFISFLPRTSPPWYMRQPISI